MIASHTETFGLVTLEAMASGLPVVAYKDDSIANMVLDGENGFMCSSKEELSTAAIQMLTDHNLRERMAKRSVEISENFSAEVNVDRTLNLYERVIKNEI